MINHDLLWKQFCHDIEHRILEARAEAGPAVCPTCGSSTPVLPEQRWCGRCERWLALGLFAVDIAKLGGRRYVCKRCDAGDRKRRRSRTALLARRRAS